MSAYGILKYLQISAIMRVSASNDEINGVYVYQLHLNCCWVHMDYDIYSTAKAHLIPTLKNYFKDLIKCMYGKACGN